MEKYAILLGYFEKQLVFIEKIHKEVLTIDIGVYDKQFVFAMRVQQLYTAIEDLFKQIAKSFENHIENMSNFHKEILSRMHIEVPKIRPAVISSSSLLLLDKVRAFRHFVRHAYDCDFNIVELSTLQHKLQSDFAYVLKDLKGFCNFVKKLS